MDVAARLPHIGCRRARVPGERQHPELGRARAPRAGPKDEEAPVGRPVEGKLHIKRREECLVCARSAGLLLINVSDAVNAIGAPREAAPIRRPHGHPVLGRIEREPRAGGAGELVDPHVGVGRLARDQAVRPADRHACAIRRKRHAVVLARLLDEPKPLPRAIKPGELAVVPAIARPCLIDQYAGIPTRRRSDSAEWCCSPEAGRQSGPVRP
jgi:hypothetical protein